MKTNDVFKLIFPDNKVTMVILNKIPKVNSKINRSYYVKSVDIFRSKHRLVDCDGEIVLDWRWKQIEYFDENKES